MKVKIFKNGKMVEVKDYTAPKSKRRVPQNEADNEEASNDE